MNIVSLYFEDIVDVGGIQTNIWEIAFNLSQKGHKCTILCGNPHSLSKDEFEIREWIVKNVKGLGYKEASHFLRNIGYKNLAIIDFHIIDVLVKNKIIKRPKTLTKKKYLEIENKLRTIAKKAKMTLAELDLYLWYMETRKVLK